MRIISILFVLLSWCRTTVVSQTFTKYSAFKQPLSVGDHVPEIGELAIVNHQSKKIRLSDFSGKSIILDFWATWCSPCIGSFGKLDSLRKKYKGTVEILPVSYQDSATVIKLLDRINKVKKTSLPSIVGDTILRKLFKHNILPHYVWIDSNGIVVAITGGDEVNDENVKNLSMGSIATLPVKADLKARLDKSVPLLQAKDNVVADDLLIYNTTLTKYMEDIVSEADFKDSTKFTATNVTLLWLFKCAFIGMGGANGAQFMSDSRVVLDIRDSILLENKFTPGESSKSMDWKRENLYCYQLQVPQFQSKIKYDIMLKDLNAVFGSLYGIEARLEKRQVKYLALIQIPATENLLRSAGGKKIKEENAFYFKLQNLPLSEFLGRLQAYYMQQFKMPIKDETGFRESVDLEISANLSNWNDLNSALEKYNLRFIEKTAEMEMIVIQQR